MSPPPDGDRQHHFLTVVGDLCQAANLAGLEVGVWLTDGGYVVGVPAPHAASAGDPAEVDDTGYAETLVIDDSLVRLQDIRSVRVWSPSSDAASAQSRRV